MTNGPYPGFSEMGDNRKIRIRELQKAAKAAAINSGFASSECRTVTEERIVVGPDGKARREVVIRVICPVA